MLADARQPSGRQSSFDSATQNEDRSCCIILSACINAYQGYSKCSEETGRGRRMHYTTLFIYEKDQGVDEFDLRILKDVNLAKYVG